MQDSKLGGYHPTSFKSCNSRFENFIMTVYLFVKDVAKLFKYTHFQTDFVKRFELEALPSPAQ